ncbi:MAG: zf-HC2 domain-containing protein [Spirochaetales bacterium]|nr:zf-HC2 domain-containing protein [Spirochaetales bacterium]
MVCPDYEVLSAYSDGEVGFPWNKELDEHISNCPSCRQKLDELTVLKEALRTSPEPDPAIPMERVRNNIARLTEKQKIIHVPVWRKKVSLPMPFVAAAFFLFCLGVVLVFSVILNLGNRSEIIVIDETDHGKKEFRIIGKNPEEIQALLESLEYKTADEEVIIRLPDDSEYFLIGEPEIIKTVDYRKSSD